jgi:hypothetical protein
MHDPTDATPQASRREPRNKGKLIGAKPPLRLKHVWSIRTKLQIAGEHAIWPCSIWQSIASSEGAMSLV